MAEARKMLDVYADFAENVTGRARDKRVQERPSERFAGAEDTLIVSKRMMQDGKALQSRYFTLFGTEFRQSVRCDNITDKDKQH